MDGVVREMPCRCIGHAGITNQAFEMVNMLFGMVYSVVFKNLLRRYGPNQSVVYSGIICQVTRYLFAHCNALTSYTECYVLPPGVMAARC